MDTATMARSVSVEWCGWKGYYSARGEKEMKTRSDTLPVEGRTERIEALEESGEDGTQHGAGRFPLCRKWFIFNNRDQREGRREFRCK